MRVKNGMAWLLVVLLLPALAMGLASCGKATPAVTTTPPATVPVVTGAATTMATVSPSATPMPTHVPVDMNPLTGRYTMNPDNAGKRPVGVMFSNIQNALPQLGIGSADLYYEMVVESGYTRIMAMFADASTIPEICSIRSARNSFVDIAMGHDALLVHFGASILCWDYMAAQGIQTLDWQFYSAGYWRDPEIAAAKGAEHSVKSNAELILGAIAGKGMRDTLNDGVGTAFHFRYPESFVPAEGGDCTHFAIPFTDWGSSPTAEFTYDADLKTYGKSQYGAPQIDGTTGEQLRTTNVFILFTTIYPLDPNGHVAARLTDGGSGYYLSGGRIQEIGWVKGGIYDPFVFTAADGSSLQVNAGKSYVCVVSSDQADRVTIG